MAYSFRAFLAIALTASLFSGSFIRASELTDKEAIRYFSQADQYLGASLSPDGSHYSIWKMDGASFQLNVHKRGVAETDTIQTYQFPSGLFNWHAWLDNTQIITSITRIPETAPILNVTSTKKTKSRVSGLTRQIYISDITTGKMVLILEYPLSVVLANNSDDFLHALPDDPEHFIMAFAPDGGEYPGVYKINVHTGATQELAAPTEPFTSWVVDRSGNLRLASGWGDDGMEIKVKQADTGKWNTLSDHPLFKEGRFGVLGFDDKGKNLYLRSSLGKGRSVIYRFDMDRTVINKKMFEHPFLDAGTLLLTNDGETILGATYVDHKPTIEFLNEAFQADYEHLQSLLNGADIIISDIDDTGNIWLVQTLSATKPAQLYIYDKSSNALSLIETKTTSDITPDPNSMTAVKFFSRDGLEIPAYLTLPSGKKDNLPFIIMPHGGPWVRDMMLYDNWAHFFANRGYGVLQPNYRGSSGYGDTFEARGYGEWGLAMQNDLVDAADWLVDEGYADKDRFCIVGGSYGGYAALVAAFKNSDTFKCAVSFAPVSDLEFWINTVASSKGERKTLMYRTVGSKKRKDLYAQSPSRQGKEVSMPLLILHGSSDIRVAPIHSALMSTALKKYTKPHELIWLKGGSHFLLQQEHREIFLRKSLDLLQETIG
ncbi:alpha/beta hydrolase family protein [Kordiimonas pumila]|uniref:Alpha/beta hydrolase family protein n=1 Tax=Kordiimonas pumila TaxID=2161677 RepID=A0ABV7D4S3_9PROT|nr:prolyl oligopeptidase family serine peptidase [Kordiimonas pumila]